MQYRTSPFHRSSERDVDVGRGARISDFIRNAQSGRDSLRLQSTQLPLALMPDSAQASASIAIPLPISVPISTVASSASASASTSASVSAPGVEAAVPRRGANDPSPLANTLIVQALAAVEQLGRLMSVNDEREKQLHLYDDAPASNLEPVRDGATRAAIDGCLASAAALLGVTQALCNRSPDPTPHERLQESRELAELTKTAGRAAYRAALLIVDPEFQRVPRPASFRAEKAQL